MPVEEARRVNDREAAMMFGPVERVHSVEETVVAPRRISVRIYRPDATTKRTLVFFHGGGWVVGSVESHDGVARILCRHGQCIVVSVDYRLAPEHKFSAAVEDAWAATESLANEATGLAVGGDSSGGNLAAVVARRSRGARLPLVLQLLVYPALDCVLTGHEGDEYAYWVSQYLAKIEDATSVEASPLREADLSGLAPAVLLPCGRDFFQDQAEAYCRRLRDAGVPARHLSYPHLIHGAFRMPRVLPGARRMLVDASAALRSGFAVGN
jgi:acetyl esterase